MVSSTSRPHFTPRKDTVSIVQEAGSALGGGQDGRKISSPPGFDPEPSSTKPVAIPTEILGPLTAHKTGLNLIRQKQLHAPFLYATYRIR